MTGDYYQLNQVVTPTVAATPDVISLLQRSNSGIWYAAIEMVNAFFLHTFPQPPQKQFIFSWQGQQHNFTVVPQKQVNSSVLCYIVQVHRTLIPVPFHEISYCFVIIMMLCCLDLVTTLDLLVRNLIVYPTKIQGPILGEISRGPVVRGLSR